MLGIKKNGSQEEFGRKLRRAFLKIVMQDHSALCIALAHHLGDQQETFFIRLLRGTTLNGLTGMRPIDGDYLRPLLGYNKEEMLAYLDDNRTAYLTDPTNASPDFLRNRLRSTVLPALKNVDDRFDAKFSSTLRSLVEEDEYLTLQAHQAFTQCFNKHDQTNELVGDLIVFNGLHPVLKRRVVLEWLIATQVSFLPSTRFIEEVIRFLSSPRGGSHCIASGCQIIKKKKDFWISSLR
ncbi:MAG: tRNA lysidine(34) synthetase TilS [Candidatus Babeliales bacterium]